MLVTVAPYDRRTSRCVTYFQMPADKRRSKRRTVNRDAWVDFGSGWRVQACVVVDISEGGARLHLPTAQYDPNARAEAEMLAMQLDQHRMLATVDPAGGHRLAHNRVTRDVLCSP